MIHLVSTQPTLRGLLAWAHRQYVLETPNLEHSASLVDEGGAPEMKPAASSYLGLAGRDDRPDDWRRNACRLDADGRYRTPLRCAVESIHPPERRLLLRDLVPEVLFPSDIARAHGIPDWAAGDVLYRSLVILRQRYRERPLVDRGKPKWTELSDSQRAAVEAGEAA